MKDGGHSSEGISPSSADSLPDEQTLLRRKRTTLFPDNPTPWLNQKIPFVFVEPFRKDLLFSAIIITIKVHVQIYYALAMM